MYQPGDQVVYGIHGVCRILEVEIKIISRKRVEYFVLVPLDHPDARYYVPCANEAAVAKMKPLLSKVALEELIRSESTEPAEWIADENRRKLHYRELINSGDRVALIRMIRSLYLHKERQLISGRKFHQSDENFLRDAERVLSAEFSLVLGIPPAAVGRYIQSGIIEE